MKKIVSLIVLLSVIISLNAQDVHFSQYYTQPLNLNPATTGFYKGDFRLTTVYKDQWKSIKAPYSSYNVSGDMRIIKQRGIRNIIGLGMYALSDKSGDGDYKTSQFGFAFSYLKNFDHFGVQYLGGGISAGYTSTIVNYDNFRFEDAFLSSGPTQEPGSNTANYFDVNMGVFYSYALDQMWSVEGGAAVFHLNEPSNSFFGNSDSKVYRKYVFHASGNYLLNTRMDFYPKVAVFLQGPHKEIDLGGFMRIRLDNMRTSKYGLYAGCWYRVGDALIPTVRFDLYLLSFAFSYDVNISKLKDASKGIGGPEFSLIFITKYKHKSPGAFFPRF